MENTVPMKTWWNQLKLFQNCLFSAFWILQKIALTLSSTYDTINSLLHAFFIIKSFLQLSISIVWPFHELSFKCCLCSMMIKRHFLHILYLCLCLDLGLFMSYLRDLFFTFIFIFIVINRIISLIQTHLLFRSFFRKCPIIFGWYCGWRVWIIFK